MEGILHQLHLQPVAHAIMAIACVAVVGMALGSVRVRGISLGSAGVLFAGILFGHFGERVDHAMLHFAKDFGLVLFVFTIGLQLGPGFVSALREQGLRLNALALSVVALGAIISVFGAHLLGIDQAAALGLLSGATTNTPSLGAVQQALAMAPDLDPARADLPAQAYAVAYPIGITGIIASLLLVRAVFRIDSVGEAAALRSAERSRAPRLERLTIRVETAGLEGRRIGEVPGRAETGVRISRRRAAGSSEVSVATEDTILHLGDELLVVGTASGLERFASIIGRPSESDLMHAPGAVDFRRVVVTSRAVLGRRIDELDLDHRFGVAVTRLARSGIELAATPDLRLRFGDTVRLVGAPEDLVRAGAALGNSTRALNETQFIPFFLGIAIGLVGGLLPIWIPGLPVPLRLGLAGGPLLAGIILSRLGHIGPLVWHMPFASNIAFRELGITLFLAAVGLEAGENFFSIAFTGTGLRWLVAAVAISMIPLLAVGIVARAVFGLNFATLSGVLAGSTTDPPALALSVQLAGSDAPHLAYAAVYPLTMLCRILTAQALAIFICR